MEKQIFRLIVRFYILSQYKKEDKDRTRPSPLLKFILRFLVIEEKIELGQGINPGGFRSENPLAQAHTMGSGIC